MHRGVLNRCPSHPIRTLIRIVEETLTPTVIIDHQRPLSF